MPRPFIPLYQCCAVRLHYDTGSGGMPHSHLIHVWCETGFDVAQLHTLLDLLSQWDYVYWRTARSSAIELTDMYARSLDAPDGWQHSLSLEHTHPGTRPATLAGASVTRAIKLITDIPGRSYRGRLFLNPLAKADIATNSIVTTSLLTAAINSLTELIVELQGQTPRMEWRVASFRHDGEWREVGVSTKINGATAVGFRVDTQRRRLGHGLI